MNILNSSAALACIILAISSCGGRSAKDSNHRGNAEQVSEQTRDNKENYKSIEHVTAASQENAAGIREIEKMVR